MHTLVAFGVVALLPLSAPHLVSQAHGQHHSHAGKPPERLGRVVFPTSCRGEAQPRFERGVALLHSFWYEQAAETFGQVIAADSGCAMGYWGEAMSILHPLWTPPTASENARGLAAAERAVRLSRPGSRERDYADAIATYFRNHDAGNHGTRLAAYEKAMEGVSKRHATDDEAQAFHALALLGVAQLHATDTTYVNQQRAAKILEPLFKKYPDHPGIAHYLIHAYDSPPLASRGVGAAGRYLEIAPSVPHALHMPSHIYIRIGDWQRAIESNLRSAEAARQFEERQGRQARWDQRAHALDYLVYAYLQLGSHAEAKRLVEEANEVRELLPANSLTNHYAVAAIPARYALERGQWREATTLKVRPAPAWRATEALTFFARAIGAARSGDTALARTSVDSLSAIETALARAGGAQTFWSGQVKIQRIAAAAWLAKAVGDTTAALRQAAEAATLEDITEKHPVTPGALLPARELYADLLLELGRVSEARRAYAESLARQPKRARSLAGAARAAELAGAP